MEVAPFQLRGSYMAEKVAGNHSYWPISVNGSHPFIDFPWNQPSVNHSYCQNWSRPRWNLVLVLGWDASDWTSENGADNGGYTMVYLPNSLIFIGQMMTNQWMDWGSPFSDKPSCCLFFYLLWKRNRPVWQNEPWLWVLQHEQSRTQFRVSYSVSQWWKECLATRGDMNQPSFKFRRFCSPFAKQSLCSGWFCHQFNRFCLWNLTLCQSTSFFWDLDSILFCFLLINCRNWSQILTLITLRYRL